MQSCEIFVISDKRVKIHGSVTAQNRESKDENSGFVFAYSRVIFAKTYLSKTIVPKGWTNWSFDGATE